MAQDAYDWADENRGELLGAIQAAGGSTVAITLADTRVEGVRHSVLEELKKWADGGMPTVESVEEAARLGGGFFQKVWEGDLSEAFMHADSSNQRIIAAAYSKGVVQAHADSEYDEGIIEERWPDE